MCGCEFHLYSDQPCTCECDHDRDPRKPRKPLPPVKKGLLTIEVEEGFLCIVGDLVRDALKAAYDDGLVDSQPWGPIRLYPEK